MKKISVAIIEHEKELRSSMVLHLNNSDSCFCEAAIGCADDALEIFSTLQPDVAIVNTYLRGMSGIDFLREVKPLCPHTQFIIFTDMDDDESIFSALHAGASGYLLKTEGPGNIAAHVEELFNGGAPMSRPVMRTIINAFHSGADGSAQGLTGREKEILDLLSNGLRYREIAERLFICMDTVRTHVQSIYRKLKVKSRTEAMLKMKFNPASSFSLH